jgi:ABC-type transport system substrate-binding protein
MKRRVVVSMGLLFVILGWGGSSVGASPPAPRGELHVVDNRSQNYIAIVYNVFEHLIKFDAAGHLVPRLATRWHWRDDRTLEFTLRQGVTFHNGEVFDAEIVKLNWEENTRLKQPFRVGEFMNFQPGARLQIVDPYTVRFVFPEPDGAALAKLSVVHMANRQFYRDVGWGEKSW